MANTMTPTDVYAVINQTYQQATGQKDIAAVDSASFTTVAEKIAGSAYVAENTLGALTTMFGKTLFAIRPYESRLSDILYINNDRWGGLQRKVSYISEGAEASEDWNTNINATQLSDGNSIDHYDIKKPKVAEYVFKGTKLMQKHITRFRDQYSMALRSEGEYREFVDGYMQEFANDVISLNEAQTRLNLLNYISALYMYTYDGTSSNRAVDLRKAYNTARGTSYTMTQIFNNSSVYQDFCQWFIVRINEDSDLMQERTTLYNTTVTGEPILRHTPKAMQRLIFNTHFMDEIKARVFSTIFHPENLKIGDYYNIPYWQSPKDGDRQKVQITTGNYMSTTNGKSINFGNTSGSGSNVEIPIVVGLLYDRDALGVNYQFDYSSTTPFNSAGGYWNMYMHWRRNYLNDFTENGILYYMTLSD